MSFLGFRFSKSQPLADETPKYLFCFDFDGTLINHDREPRFHPEMRDWLQRRQREGHYFVINTGRSLFDTVEKLGHYGVFLSPNYLIARESEIYRPSKWGGWKNAGDWNRRVAKLHSKFLKEHREFLKDLEEEVMKLTNAQFLRDGHSGDTGVVANSDNEMEMVCQILERMRNQAPDLGWQRNGVYLRFLHHDLGKGSALQELCRQLNVKTSHVFVGGDNYNDLSMLDPDVATQIACPENALPAIREHVLQVGGYVANAPASEGMLESLKFFFPDFDSEIDAHA